MYMAKIGALGDLLVSVRQKIRKVISNVFRLNIELLKKGRGMEMDRFSYQNKIINFDIKNGEKVLDIGSGGYPFPFATHLSDFYENETTHRSVKLKIDNRPFTFCNIESIPFKDKEFDFVYCSHVLEHVDNPAKACEELMRIGKRGYIETPTKTSDIMFNFTRLQNHHKWHAHISGNTIIFIEWMDVEMRDTGTNYFFDQFHATWKNPFQELVYNNRDLFVNMFLWKDRFHYIIINKEGKIINTTVL